VNRSDFDAGEEVGFTFPEDCPNECNSSSGPDVEKCLQCFKDNHPDHSEEYYLGVEKGIEMYFATT